MSTDTGVAGTTIDNLCNIAWETPTHVRDRRLPKAAFSNTSVKLFVLQFWTSTGAALRPFEDSI